jgi:hypothetical protein
MDVEQLAKAQCEGQQSCELQATNRYMGSDPCGGTYKYLQVDYQCVAAN